MGNSGSGTVGPVVSVRLSADVVERLDRLVERTGRSRGHYLREAITEMLPVLEERYWAHEVERAERAQEEVFTDLLAQLNDQQKPELSGQGREPDAEEVDLEELARRIWERGDWKQP